LRWRLLTSGAWRDTRRAGDLIRGAYDANAVGTAAPATEFASAAEIRRLLANFRDVQIRRENCNDLVVQLLRKTLVIPRSRLLSMLGRFAGLDLYVTARK
jgi:hypothetical protein